MRLKNIIIVYDYAFINGGAAKIAIQSAISLSKQNYNVYYYSAVGPVCKDLMSSNVKTHCLNQKDINTANRITAIRTGIWNSSVKKDFHHFLSSFSQEDTIVHIHGWVKALSSAVVKTSTKMKFKTFITLHDYFTLCPNGGFYNFKRNSICHFKGFGLKCLLCNCDKRNYIQKLWRSARQVIQDFNVKRNADIIFISISNLNEKDEKGNVIVAGNGNYRAKFLHMAQLTVSPDSPWIGKTFGELDLRLQYGVTIVSVLRGSHRYNIPKLDTILMPGDRLSVVGTDTHLQNFASRIEVPIGTVDHEDVMMYKFSVSQQSILIDMTIDQFNMMCRGACTIIGIERSDGSFIEPLDLVRFKPYDMVWIAGDKEMIERVLIGNKTLKPKK